MFVGGHFTGSTVLIAASNTLVRPWKTTGVATNRPGVGALLITRSMPESTGGKASWEWLSAKESGLTKMASLGSESFRLRSETGFCLKKLESTRNWCGTCRMKFLLLLHRAHTPRDKGAWSSHDLAASFACTPHPRQPWNKKASEKNTTDFQPGHQALSHSAHSAMAGLPLRG